jgi:hypothetical protein
MVSRPHLGGLISPRYGYARQPERDLPPSLISRVIRLRPPGVEEKAVTIAAVAVTVVAGALRV